MLYILFIKYSTRRKKFILAYKAYKPSISIKETWQSNYPNCIYLETMIFDKDYANQCPDKVDQEIYSEFKKYNLLFTKLNKSLIHSTE